MKIPGLPKVLPYRKNIHLLQNFINPKFEKIASFSFLLLLGRKHENNCQDAPMPFSGGSRISRRGERGPPTWVLFGKNVCKNERIGSRRGGVRPARPALDPPMPFKRKEFNLALISARDYIILRHAFHALPSLWFQG